MSSDPPAKTLPQAALLVLTTADAGEKAETSRAMATRWREGGLVLAPGPIPPDRPARPDRPELRAPSAMPKRKKAQSPAARIALLHALAHIELNAIDLAWDVVARFADPAACGGLSLPRGFFDDWVTVGDEEGKHFLMLADRLATLGAAYGDLPAHDGLWQASADTAHDLLARLAVVPMVLEARGLDVTPAMIANLRRAGDDPSADVLQVIHDDEIGHVATGRRWFEHVAKARGLDPWPTWQELVRTYFRGTLKRPFNAASRSRAGLEPEVYEPLAER